MGRKVLDALASASRQLTVLTKSNAQQHAMVMWDQIAAEVAGEFPDVRWDKELVDAMTARMVNKPVTTGRRAAALPGVPTLEEAGVKGISVGTWFGLLAPAATPKDIVARLSAERVKVIQSPEFRQRMEEIGAEPVGNSAEQRAAQIRSETEKFARRVKEAKVTVE